MSWGLALIVRVAIAHVWELEPVKVAEVRWKED
jgi:hypothetical protein